MTGQMCWLSQNGPNGDKILHLRLEPNQAWQPYTECPDHAVPDYDEPGGSLGWATYQALFKAGWHLVPAAEAQPASLLTR